MTPDPPDPPDPPGPRPTSGPHPTPGPDPTPAPPAPAPPSRAGRNLPAAVGVGLGLAVVIMASLFVVRVAFVVVCTVAIVVAVAELRTALAVRGVRVPVLPVAAGAAGMLAAAWVAGPDALGLGLALTVIAVLVWRLLDPAEGFTRDVSAGVLAVLYVPFLAGFSMLLLRADDGAWRVLTFFLVVVASDVGGYAVGVLAGRHPMAPTVSPKKSWEGFAGSLLTCVGCGVLAVTLGLHGSWVAGAFLGVAAVCSATLGDLGESLLKRDLGIKDMGTLLPGHGGIMDRLDSLLPSAPVVWLVLLLLVPVSG